MTEKNTRRKSKSKAADVSIEDSARVETNCQPTQMAGGNNNQGNELEKLIAAAFEKAMPTILANLKRADEQPNTSKKERCTCKTFMSYKPRDFSGEEDTMETVKWLEEMKVILDMNDCAEEDKVRVAAHSFKSEALFWWHAIVQTQGRDVVQKMSWEEFRQLVIEKFCSSNELWTMEGEFLKLKMTGLEHRKYTTKFNELSMVAPHLVTPESSKISRYISGLAPEISMHLLAAKLSTFQSAVDLAARITDNKIGEENEKVSAKRKWEDSRGKRNIDRFKKQGSRGIRCIKCNEYHYGEYNLQTCCYCNATGHIARDCTGWPICYVCGVAVHIRPNYPELAHGTSGSKN